MVLSGGMQLDIYTLRSSEKKRKKAHNKFLTTSVARPSCRWPAANSSKRWQKKQTKQNTLKTINSQQTVPPSSYNSQRMLYILASINGQMEKKLLQEANMLP